MCNMTTNDNMDVDRVNKPKPLPDIPPYGPNAIEVENLSFSYRSTDAGSSIDDPDRQNNVLKNLNLSLPTGSRCLLIGANGSGKCWAFYLLVFFFDVCQPDSNSCSSRSPVQPPPPLRPSLNFQASRRCFAFWQAVTSRRAGTLPT